ncbi:MAG: alpha/beta hydrolase [Polyangiaceae bacterium]
MGKKLEFALGVLNGAIGDYLQRTGNGLATSMSFVKDGEPIATTKEALAAAYPHAKKKIVVLVHGLMCTETAFDLAGGGDYGSLLERDLGVTPLYVRYNSGLPVADNGASFSGLLRDLVENFPAPVEDILLLGYSMGGLIVRSACHVAGLEHAAWLALVKRIIYVGTPHRGAPLERGGRVVSKILTAIPDPYTKLIAEIADLRSEGLQDLGDAELRHEDRARRRKTFRLTDVEHPVPLLPSVQHYLVAGALSSEPWIQKLFGDSIVPLTSATNHSISKEAILPPDHVKIVPGISHVDLARSLDVYAHVKAFAERAS